MKTAHCAYHLILSNPIPLLSQFYCSVHFRHIASLSRLLVAVVIDISECYLSLLLKEICSLHACLCNGSSNVRWWFCLIYLLLPDAVDRNVQKFCFLEIFIFNTKKLPWLRNSIKAAMKSHCFGLCYSIFFPKNLCTMLQSGVLCKLGRQNFYAWFLRVRLSPTLWRRTCILCIFFVLI